MSVDVAAGHCHATTGNDVFQTAYSMGIMGKKWKTKNEKGKTKKEKWKTKNEKRKMKNEKWIMKNEKLKS